MSAEDRLAGYAAVTIQREGKPCKIFRRTLGTQNRTGGIGETYEQVGTAPAIARPKMAQGESLAGQQVQTRGDWVVTFPRDTVVKNTDRLEIDGQSFDVLDTNAGMSPRVKLIAYCVRSLQ